MAYSPVTFSKPLTASKVETIKKDFFDHLRRSLENTRLHVQMDRDMATMGVRIGVVDHSRQVRASITLSEQEIDSIASGDWAYAEFMIRNIEDKLYRHLAAHIPAKQHGARPPKFPSVGGEEGTGDTRSVDGLVRTLVAMAGVTGLTFGMDPSGYKWQAGAWVQTKDNSMIKVVVEDSPTLYAAMTKLTLLANMASDRG